MTESSWNLDGLWQTLIMSNWILVIIKLSGCTSAGNCPRHYSEPVLENKHTYAAVCENVRRKTSTTVAEILYKYADTPWRLHQSKLTSLQRRSNSNFFYENQNHPRNTMKVFAVLAVLAVFAYASTTALPAAAYDGLIQGDDGQIVKLEDVDTAGGLSTATELSPIRHRRVTCDILSVQTPWGGVNHAACAARCIFQKHKGGACRDGVCQCRD